jgi:hypothetical protein
LTLLASSLFPFTVCASRVNLRVVPAMSAVTQSIFEDGFESGDFSAWSGTTMVSGETATVGYASGHHGNYGASFTSNGGKFERSCSYEKISESNELYARGYFYVSESGINVSGDSLYFIMFLNGSNGKDANLAYAGWSRKGGVDSTQWCLTVRNGTRYIDVHSPSPVCITGQWYCVELHWKNDPLVGLAEMWVDGVLVCSSRGLDTAAYGGADTCRFGLAEINGGKTVVSLDCVEINTVYIGPESTHTLSFKDGFESGSFSAWSGIRAVNGETASVTRTRVQREGNNSAVFMSDGGGGFERAYCCEYAVAAELYVRGYFYVSRSGIDADGERFFFIVLRSGVNGLAYAGWKSTDGNIKWCMTIRDGTDYFDAYSEDNSAISRWYCVELHWMKHRSSGYAEMWVDGVLVCSSRGLDTAAYGDTSAIHIGLAELYGCSGTTVHCDSVAISEAYIGQEPFPLTPSLDKPSNKASIYSPVTLSWTNSSGATSYQVETNGSSPVTASSNSCNVTLSTGSYTWRVRAINASGWSDWSSSRAFTVLPPPVPPHPPSPIAPTNSMTSANTSIAFSWTGSLGATSYQVEINGPSRKLENISVTSYITTLPLGSYTWRVRAINTYGWSEWSGEGVFNLVSPGVDWWIYLCITGAVMAVALIFLLVRRSRTPTFHHRIGDDHPF